MAYARSGSAAALHYATITPDGWALMEESFFTLGISMGGQPEVTRPEDCSILVETAGRPAVGQGRGSARPRSVRPRA